MFKKISKMRSHHQIIFSVLIGLAVVAFWRGCWRLMDMYLFPNNYQLSGWISLIIGAGILVGTHYAVKELM